MRTIILAALLAASAQAAWAADRNFAVGAFDRIILSGTANVAVSRAPAVSVVASGDEADLDRLDIRVENGALVIGQKPGSSRWYSRKGVSVAVAAPALSAATISGAGNMVVDRIDRPFDARISGAGDLQLPDIQSPRLGIAISGAGNLRAAGRCDEGTIRVSGTGNVRAAELTCRVLDTQVSGTGNVAVGATETASAKVSGIGNIRITGGARCTTSSSGLGTVRCG